MSTTHPLEVPSSLQPQLVLPDVETRVFEGRQNASFYVGALASRNVVYLPSEFLGALKLRANVYIDESHYLEESHRQADGTESDNDDVRSVHYGIIENATDGPRVVGNIRGIIKDDERSLPVENIFPEIFEDSPAPLGALEASRYIARHPDRSVQSAISLGLIRVIVTQAANNGNQPIFAIAEESMVRHFNRLNLPFEKISDPRPVVSYNNTENMVLRFNPVDIIEQIHDSPEQRKILARYFRTVYENGGLGYYDRCLTDPIN